MKTIRSRDNSFAKHLISLAHSARERKRSRSTVLDGAHLVDAYLDSAWATTATTASDNSFSLVIRESALCSPDAKAILKKLPPHITPYLLADTLFDEASSLDSPAAIMAVIATPVSFPIPANASPVVVLDGVQDPGNVGAILRSAAAFGFNHAVLGMGSAFAWSPKVIRAGQGAHFAVNIVEGVDVVVWMAAYQGRTLALVPDSTNGVKSPTTAAITPIFRLNLAASAIESIAFLIGSEGTGLHENVIASAHVKVSIPMSGKMESLNAAACASIAMYEWARQQSDERKSGNECK